MGDAGTDISSKIMSAFSDSRSVEILNSRAAMVGWTIAFVNELVKGTPLFGQVFVQKTFAMSNGTVTETLPSAGLFLVPVVVFFVIAASLAPKLQGQDDDGLKTASEGVGPLKDTFTVEAELFNGRAAMVGLVALAITEQITGKALF